AQDTRPTPDASCAQSPDSPTSATPGPEALTRGRSPTCSECTYKNIINMSQGTHYQTDQNRGFPAPGAACGGGWCGPSTSAILGLMKALSRTTLALLVVLLACDSA